MSVKNHIAELKKKHAALDVQLHGLQRTPAPCVLKVTELKKAKLALKERIDHLNADAEGETSRADDDSTEDSLQRQASADTADVLNWRDLPAECFGRIPPRGTSAA